MVMACWPSDEEVERFAVGVGGRAGGYQHFIFSVSPYVVRLAVQLAQLSSHFRPRPMIGIKAAWNTCTTTNLVRVLVKLNGAMLRLRSDPRIEPSLGSYGALLWSSYICNVTEKRGKRRAEVQLTNCH